MKSSRVRTGLSTELTKIQLVRTFARFGVVGPSFTLNKGLRLTLPFGSAGIFFVPDSP
jgi:hypothetical protein